LLSLRGVVSLSLLFHGGVGLAHIGGYTCQGYIIVVELATYRVPEDPASPAPVGGYVVACTAFYE
jgi:hypothetical protein